MANILTERKIKTVLMLHTYLNELVLTGLDTCDFMTVFCQDVKMVL